MHSRIPLVCQFAMSAGIGMIVSWRPNALSKLKSLVIQIFQFHGFRTELEFTYQMPLFAAKSENVEPRACSGHVNVFEANYANPDRRLGMDFPVHHQFRPPVRRFGIDGGVIGQPDPISQTKST